jgi:hypothetical protein
VASEGSAAIAQYGPLSDRSAGREIEIDEPTPSRCPGTYRGDSLRIATLRFLSHRDSSHTRSWMGVMARSTRREASELAGECDRRLIPLPAACSPVSGSIRCLHYSFVLERCGRRLCSPGACPRASNDSSRKASTAGDRPSQTCAGGDARSSSGGPVQRRGRRRGRPCPFDRRRGRRPRGRSGGDSGRLRSSSQPGSARSMTGITEGHPHDVVPRLT